MRFGFVVPNNVGIDDAQSVVGLGMEAEQLGFDSVWVNHHVLNEGYVRERLGTRPYQDALVTLTWLAANTARVRLGTSVLVLPYLHPMLLAKQLATLDQLCNGRLIIAVGVGSLPEENAALGTVPYTARGRYSDESLSVLKCLWTEEAASFHGEFFAFDDAISSPRPKQQPHPPLLVGGNRPAALRRVAAYADGWHPMSLPPQSVAKRLPQLDAALRARGRDSLEFVQVRLDMRQVTPDNLAAYEKLGVTDLIVSSASADLEQQTQDLRTFADAYLQ